MTVPPTADPDRKELEALAGRGKAVKPGLAAWRDRAKATRREESKGVAGGSAGALVIGDHRERSGGPLPTGS